MLTLRSLLARCGPLKAAYHVTRALCFQTLLAVSPVLLARVRHRAAWSRWPDFDHPTTFDEKLLWLNLHWQHPLKTECGDKYTLRGYVERHGLGHLLPRLYGVYESVEEIDFGALPFPCVLKCSHGCKCNVFCRSPETLDAAAARRDLRRWMNTDYSWLLGELHYAGMKPRIICEEFLEDGPALTMPNDYKVFCFDGKAFCTMLATKRDPNGTARLAFYDLPWKNKLPYCVQGLAVDQDVLPPAAYDELIRAAEGLSQPFAFVRMDFYSINGRAVLGEMTFTPGGCVSADYLTEVAQRELGALLKLPEKRLHPEPGRQHSQTQQAERVASLPSRKREGTETE